MAEPSNNATSSGSSSLSRSTSTSAPRGYHASVACGSCRIAKKRCDQGQPCDYCRKHHKNCVYDAGQDARRPAVRKRRNEDLQYRSRALDTILDTLKTAPPAQAHRVLELIRQDQPLDHIISSISLLQTASARGRTGSNHTRDRLAIDVLCDAPPIQVPASPWTSITSGSDTASHLMSAYFNWCHFYYYFFDEQLFLEGMRQADLNSPYCSPLMVNACLGIGCLFTDDPCAFSDAADPSTRGQHFFNEAHRLWTETAACATLANVSGLLLLIMLSALLGKDRISIMILPQLPVMLQQVLKKHAKDESLQSLDRQRSIRILQWTHFVCQNAFGISLMSPGFDYKPPTELPFSPYEHDRLGPWSAYPLRHDPIQINRSAVFNCICEAWKFGAEIKNMVLTKFPSMGVEERYITATAIHKRMIEWYLSLPEEFNCDRPGFVLCGPTADLTTTYCNLCHHCFFWILSSDADTGPSHKSPEDDIRSVLVTTAMALRDIIRRFKAEFGRSSWSILMPAPCVTALNALVHYLDSSDVQDLFQELFTLLSESALRWNVTKGMTRVILGMIESKGDAVPPELRKSLQAIAAGQWKSQDHLQFSSSYPNYVMVRQKLEAPEMSDLLEQWAGLNFGDEPAEIGDSTEAGAAKALG